jgi:hypothetical protein
MMQVRNVLINSSSSSKGQQRFGLFDCCQAPP